MTPEERVVTLKDLLARLRTNASDRLEPRSGDEEEFVPRSVLAARAAKAVLAAEVARAASDLAMNDFGPAIEMGAEEMGAEELELELFDPFDELDAEELAAEDRAAEELAAEDRAAEELLSVSLPDEELVPVPHPPTLPAAPTSSLRAVTPRAASLEAPVPEPSRVVATQAAPRAAPDEDVTGDDERPRLAEIALGLSFDETSGEDLTRPSQLADPLATTSPNQLPAVLFERALFAEATRDDEAPVSSRRAVDLDRPAEVDLDSEPPPESGEVASQRQSATSMRDLDLDAPTPSAGDGERVAREIEERFRAEALARPEVLPSAPPPTRPVILGRPPLAATCFLDVLDAALALAEDER